MMFLVVWTVHGHRYSFGNGILMRYDIKQAEALLLYGVCILQEISGIT
jgi:hypothetical protein